jgi:hypothetical protein
MEHGGIPRSARERRVSSLIEEESRWHTSCFARRRVFGTPLLTMWEVEGAKCLIVTGHNGLELQVEKHETILRSQRVRDIAEAFHLASRWRSERAA